VKVNSIVIPGVNDDHVRDIAVKVAELGADIQNCMPMYPNAGTPFEAIPEPTPALMARLRHEAGEFIQQMNHCMRCRADAVGLLDDDKCAEFRQCLSNCSKANSTDTKARPYVAVASMEGMLVNQHLGEARRFHIWACTEDGYQLVELRDAPEPGTGTERWRWLARLLSDCRAVLVSGLGETPKKVLEESGIMPIEMTGFVQRGLEAIYEGADLSRWKGRRQGCAKGSGCSGDAMGCG
jgi:nitrogen fixation protein NifB